MRNCLVMTLVVIRTHKMHNPHQHLYAVTALWTAGELMYSKLTKGIDTKRLQGTAQMRGMTNGARNGRSGKALRTHDGEKRLGKIITIWVLCFLVLGVFAVLTYQSQQRNTMATDALGVEPVARSAQKPVMEIKGTAHNPIYITSNADFASQASANGWQGNGSQENPYIIENYDIDSNGGAYCIWIENTDVWFVIRNCILWNATSPMSEPDGAGIYLKNVQNGTIDNNTCTNNYYGIYMYSSSNNEVANNNCSGNLYYGICIEWSSSNNIFLNNCSGNSRSGIYIGSDSNSNNITNNNCSGNVESGICLYGSSNHNNITDNNCSGNYYGINLLESSSNNNITNNWISANYEGIHLYWFSNDNNITKNSFCSNTEYAIAITYHSSGNTIQYNKFWQNHGTTKGVNGNCQAYDDEPGGNYWYNSSTQEGNYWSNWDGKNWGTPNAYPIAGSTTSYDIYPSGPHAPIHINGNADFQNQASTNGWTGDGSQGNPYIIAGYEIDGNGGTYCIWIENTDVWFVIRNCNLWNATSTASEPWGTGIYLKNVTNGTLENNNCSDNYGGIHLYSSSSNTVTNNNCFGNFFEGIYFDFSSNNTITNNNCSGNGYGISLYYSSSNNTITNNNCSHNTQSGIYLAYSSSNNTITNNNCSGNSWHGIYLRSSSSNNTVTNNICSDNWQSGIYLAYSSSNNTITNNNCSHNTQSGIYLAYSSSNNTITNNNLYHNPHYAIKITSSSTGNIIHHNNFYQNNGAGKGLNGNSQAYDDAGGNYWYNNTAQEGNYWSNWDGNDWGTASAYPIDGGKASDWYPLGNPTPELSPVTLILVALGLLCVAALRKRK